MTSSSWARVFAGIVILAGVLMLLDGLRSCTRGAADGPPQGVRIIVKRDTVRDTVQAPPRYYSRIVPTVVYRDRQTVAQIDTVSGDTQLVANPFRAAFDTRGAGVDTLGTVQDSVRVRGTISFPPLALVDVRVDLPPSVNTLIGEVREIEITRGPPWYEELGRAVFWAGVGYGVRWLTEPTGHLARDALVAPLAPGEQTAPTMKISLTVPF